MSDLTVLPNGARVEVEAVVTQGPAPTQRRLAAGDGSEVTVTVTWEVVGSDVSVADIAEVLNGGLTLIVNAAALDPVAATTLRALATIQTANGPVVAFSQVIIPAAGTDDPPRVGTVEAHVPAAGSGNAWIELEAPHWVDDDEDLPLSYTFLTATGDRSGETLAWWQGRELTFAAVPLAWDGDPALDVPSLPRGAPGLNTVAVIVTSKRGRSTLSTSVVTVPDLTAGKAPAEVTTLVEDLLGDTTSLLAVGTNVVAVGCLCTHCQLCLCAGFAGFQR